MKKIEAIAWLKLLGAKADPCRQMKFGRSIRQRRISNSAAAITARRVKKLKLQERRAVIPCRRSLAACRPLGFLGRSVVPIVGRRANGGRRMEWARILAYITGTVDQELLLRNEYLAAENRM